MTRKTVNVNYGQICFRISQEAMDKADALISRLALLDGLHRSVSRSDVLREAAKQAREALRLRLDNEDLRARIVALLDVLRAARPEIECDVATAREEGRTFHEKQIGDVLARIDDALRGAP